jgi:hypothetical protein
MKWVFDEFKFDEYKFDYKKFLSHLDEFNFKPEDIYV